MKNMSQMYYKFYKTVNLIERFGAIIIRTFLNNKTNLLVFAYLRVVRKLNLT